MPESLLRTALEAVAMSTSADFESPLAWGQWCRNLAWASLYGRADEVEVLRKRLPAQYRNVPIGPIDAAIGAKPADAPERSHEMFVGSVKEQMESPCVRCGRPIGEAWHYAVRSGGFVHTQCEERAARERYALAAAD
jgi:hypothetical protein